MQCQNRRRPAAVLQPPRTLRDVEHQMTPDHTPTGRAFHTRVEAAMTADRRFVVTFFADVYGQDLTEKEMSLDELRDLVLTTTARQKSDLPLLKLANFGIERSAENSLRHNANVLSVTGIEGDYDDKEMAFDRAVELLSQARLKGLVYTSPSYAAVSAEVARRLADVHGPDTIRKKKDRRPRQRCSRWCLG